VRPAKRLAQFLDFFSRTTAAQNRVTAPGKFIHHRASETARDSGDEDYFSVGHDRMIVGFISSKFQFNSCAFKTV
jgi:hypothetical protein